VRNVHRDHGAARVTNTVVKITAGHSVRYSLDGGFTLTEFEPGEFYAVPPYARDGMIRRGWAKLATEEDTLVEEKPPQPDAEEDHKKSKKRS
jgi:hypothetical protein